MLLNLLQMLSGVRRVMTENHVDKRNVVGAISCTIFTLICITLWNGNVNRGTTVNVNRLHD